MTPINPTAFRYSPFFSPEAALNVTQAGPIWSNYASNQAQVNQLFGFRRDDFAAAFQSRPLDVFGGALLASDRQAGLQPSEDLNRFQSILMMSWLQQLSQFFSQFSPNLFSGAGQSAAQQAAAQSAPQGYGQVAAPQASAVATGYGQPTGGSTGLSAAQRAGLHVPSAT